MFNKEDNTIQSAKEMQCCSQRMKTQLAHNERFRDNHEAELGLFTYIEAYYNRWRRHSAIGYRTTAEFELYLESLHGVA